MDQHEHFLRLASMYDAAPVNGFYLPRMTVEEGKASIDVVVSEQHHHSAGAVHGSVYFKMLDDAAFFAANSYEQDVFVLTTSFTTYLTRPVSSGKIKSIGQVVNKNKQQFIAEAVLYDENDNELGRGSGVFVRGKTLLADARGYSD